MNFAHLLAVLLIATPALAQAAPHSVIVRVVNGKKSYAQTHTVEVGGQINFAGKIDGHNMVNNFNLAQNGDTFYIQYQVDYSSPDKLQTFIVQSSMLIKSGYGVRAVELGDWKLDIAFDTPMGDNEIPSSAPSGDNLRLKTVAGKTSCTVVSPPGTQSSVNEARLVDSRQLRLNLTTVVAVLEKGASNIQYQISGTGITTAQGEKSVRPGKKASAEGGKVTFLLDGAK